MGVLVGYASKLLYGVLATRTKNEMMKVTRRITRVTKEITQRERSLQSQKQAALNQADLAFQTVLNEKIQDLTDTFNSGWLDPASGELLPGKTQEEYNAAYQREVTQKIEGIKAQLMAKLATDKQQIETEFEYYEMNDLEPLKQQEEYYKEEKIRLETIANEYDEAYKLAESNYKSGADDMKMSGNS